jgi:para-aminobenzoate synthetase / 4-amino-4-deoxychorismate lyase
MTPLPAPDPAQGLFETLLVLDGEAVELEAHLDRLTAGLFALYDTEPPRDLALAVRQRAQGFDLARLRIVVAPPAANTAGTGANPSSIKASKWEVELAVETVEPEDHFPGRDRGANLLSLSYDGGLGSYKWADRRPLAAIPAPAIPLLLDRNDEVLEAGRANVFLVRAGALFTPADDGRILPGIARGAVMETADEAGIRVEEKRLTLADLSAADEVFLTGSVRGVEPARSLDGQPLPQIGEFGHRVAVRLRRRWRTGRPKGAAGLAGRL